MEITYQVCINSQRQLVDKLRNDITPRLRQLREKRRFDGNTFEIEEEEEKLEYEIEVLFLRYEGYERMKNNIGNAETIIKEYKEKIDKLTREYAENKILFREYGGKEYEQEPKQTKISGI